MAVSLALPQLQEFVSEASIATFNEAELASKRPLKMSERCLGGHQSKLAVADSSGKRHNSPSWLSCLACHILACLHLNTGLQGGHKDHTLSLRIPEPSALQQPRLMARHSKANKMAGTVTSIQKLLQGLQDENHVDVGQNQCVSIP